MTHSRCTLLALSLLVCALSPCAAESSACAESDDCTGAGDASILLQKEAHVNSENDPTEDALKKEEHIVDAVGKDLEKLTSELDSDTTGKQEEADIDAALKDLKKIAAEEQDDGSALEEHAEEEEPMSNECKACVDNTWTQGPWPEGSEALVELALPAFEQCKADCATPECRHGCRKTAQEAALELFNHACPVCNSKFMLNDLQESVPKEHVDLDDDAAEIASLLMEDGAEDEHANGPFSGLTTACATCVKGTWKDARHAGQDMYKACTDKGTGAKYYEYCKEEAHKAGRAFLDKQCASHCQKQPDGAEDSTEKDLDKEEDAADGANFMEENDILMNLLEENSNGPSSGLTTACATCVKGVWKDARHAGQDMYKACTNKGTGAKYYEYCKEEAHKEGRAFLDKKCASHCQKQPDGAEDSTEKDLDKEEDAADGANFLEEDDDMMDFLEEINYESDVPEDERGEEQAGEGEGEGEGDGEEEGEGEGEGDEQPEEE